VDLKVLEEREAHVDQVAHRVLRETEDKMDPRDLLVNEDLLELKVVLVSPDLKDQLVPQERTDCQDTQEAEEKLVSKVKPVLLAPLVLLAHKVQLVRTDNQEKEATLVLKVPLVKLVFLALLETKALRVTEDPLVFLARSDLLEPKVSLVTEECKDQWVLLVLKVAKDLPAHLDLAVQLEDEDHQDPLVKSASLVSPDPVDLLALLERKETSEKSGDLVHLDEMVFKDLPVYLDLLATPVLAEKMEIRENVVHLDLVV